MEIKSSDLVSLFEQALTGVSSEKLDEIGVVIQVGDAVCKVYGLTNAVYAEQVLFEGGNKGIILNLDEDYVDIFLLDTGIPVVEQEVVKRTGSVFKAPVGKGLLGRVINAVGDPIDGLGALPNLTLRPVEAEIPGIVERSPVNQPLDTGLMVIDALVPIGRGQRELIIGNRNTGKTALALDVILNQRGKNVYCVYVSIGQRQGNLARIMYGLQERGALEYTVIVSADSGEAVLNQYLAPYVGCTIAESLREEGHDVVIVYDDLSNHAVSYREMSLLLRRPPGREAFPGDVFYLHSRLLERAGKLASGGSITALPIVTIQSDDITAYIPTNLISITDGQIFLDATLFNNGIRPAVNVELSVSRVGGAAQTKAMKQVTRALRLELAQYNELLDFAQFGAELDLISQRRLKRGKLAVELLKQPQYVRYSLFDQVLMLFLLKENFLDTLSLDAVSSYVDQFISYVPSVYPEFSADIKANQAFTPDEYQMLIKIAKEFNQLYVSSDQ
jgi:F-type H+/Na+-transporting ATPase subunit alpha